MDDKILITRALSPLNLPYFIFGGKCGVVGILLGVFMTKKKLLLFLIIIVLP
jgi:hypothetical protein